MKNYWVATPIKTMQYHEIKTKIQDCKRSGKTGMIIGNTGFGKSGVTEEILANAAKQPHTYVVTVSSLYKLIDIVNELCEKLDVGTKSINSPKMSHYSVKIRLDMIAKRIKELHKEGHKVQLIIDEGENMNMEILKMLKGLFDLIFKHCSIVVLGTDQLLTKLLNQRRRNRDAIPQLFSRFKAGLKVLTLIDKKIEFPKFLDALEIKDKGLRKLVTSLADNYRELRDYLEGFLQECDEMNMPVTEEQFRLYHDIPVDNSKVA